MQKMTYFGSTGRGTNERGILHTGDAQLSEALRTKIKNAGGLKRMYCIA